MDCQATIFMKRSCERPDLNGKMAYFPEQGAHGQVVIIGDEIFKTPILAGDAQAFRQEYEVLRQLQDKGLPVPEVTCVGENAPFYGMKRVPGVAVDSVLARMTPMQQEALGKDLADFSINMARILPSDNGRIPVHLDMNAGNVFVDPGTKKLTALIDFGGIAYIPKDGIAICPCVNTSIRQTFLQQFNNRKDEIPKGLPAATKPRTAEPRHHKMMH